MLIANHQGLGESANDLVKKWGNSGYRYGFPDFYAAEFPVRPMYYDQSRIYSGVIGRHYPNAETMRYHTLYDPNMYMQPGFGAAGGMTAQQAIQTFEGLLAIMPSGSTYSSFDVAFDTAQAGGAGIDGVNKLWVIHGQTLAQLQLATAAAGGTFGTQTPDSDLAKRLTRARETNALIVASTLGKLDDVRYSIENMVATLKAGTATAIAPAPLVVTQAAASLNPMTWSRRTKIVAGVTIGVLALGGLTAVLLTRR